MNLQNLIMSPSTTSLIKKAAEKLTESQEVEIKKFCDEYNLDLKDPVYLDYMKFETYIKQLDKCRNCTAVEVGCSAKKIYVDSVTQHLKTFDIGCTKLKAEKIIHHSGVPDKFKSSRSKDFKYSPENLPALTAAMRTVRNRDSLYIYGDAGCGKTMLSSIIINERAFLGAHSRFYTVTDLLESLRDYVDSFSREEKLIKIKTAPCLVIDDIGAEHITDWVSSSLFNIIDYRYKGELQTIFNSNFDLESLCKRYTGYHGERIYRRIRAMCQVVKLF